MNWWRKYVAWCERLERERGARLVFKQWIVDIHDPVFTICRRLGVVPTDVSRLTIHPTDIEAVVYKRNERGKAYVDQTGEVATYEIRVRVIT